MATPAQDDQRWLDRAVALATANVAQGGGPFGAVLVRGGEEIASGQNRVTLDLDPTAHAEVVGIRNACRALVTHELQGLTLYSSCEPCPLCLTACLWARLDRVVYAADRGDAARAGFDDRVFYELLDQPRSAWPTPVEQQPSTAAQQPFTTWLAHEARIHY